jgi:hypothetical protein
MLPKQCGLFFWIRSLWLEFGTRLPACPRHDGDNHKQRFHIRVNGSVLVGTSLRCNIFVLDAFIVSSGLFHSGRELTHLK